MDNLAQSSEVSFESFIFREFNNNYIELKKPYSKHNSNNRHALDRCFAVLLYVFVSGFWRIE